MNSQPVSIVLLLLSSIIISCSPNEVTDAEMVAEVDSAAILYEVNCASCHGIKLNGFVDRDWKYGSDTADIMTSIRTGYPDAGMPSFEMLLNEEQRREIAEYILAGIENAGKYDFNEVTSAIFEENDLTVRLDTVASGMDNPWAMAFLPGGDMLITERSGKLYRIDRKGTMTEVSGVPEVLDAGQGGLLDIELHPDYDMENWIYLTFSKPKTEGDRTLATTAIVRGKLNGYQLLDVEEIFEALPYHTTRHHYGSRMVFGNDGHLYFSVGDRGRRDENPQDLSRDPGKIHRIMADGSIPPDNPFVNDTSARPTIYSYGHRNPQGLIRHPGTGEIWEHEHGPRGGDELNLIQPGRNYGWPIISYGINYDGSVFTTLTEKAGMEQPVTYWVPSIAPSGFAVVTGNRYPAWKGNLLIGSLRFRYLNRVVLGADGVQEEEILLENIGRTRFVEMGPDGYIYVGVEEPGFVFRLHPQ